jgi:capsular polysaccharide export protein
MRLLFWAVTKHQYRYFKRLSQHLSYESRVAFFPSLFVSRKGWLFQHKEVQRECEAIVENKYREIEKKYSSTLYKQCYRLFLRWQIPWVQMVTYGLCREYKPDYVVVWNGKKFHQAIAVVVAKHLGVRPLFFENGLLPHTTTMDFQGVNATNAMPRVYGFYERLPVKEGVSLPTTLVARQAKRAKRECKDSLPKSYIFVPFQVAYDTQIIQHSPWVEDMFALFALLERLSEALQIAFVIKEHPSDRTSDYSSLHAKRLSTIQFSSKDTQTLIENATAVLTINSSVAVEALLFKKRVIVLGEAFFAIEGIVKVAQSEGELKLILEGLSTWRGNEDVIEKFLIYLYTEYLIPGDWRDPHEKHFEAVEARLGEGVC